MARRKYSVDEALIARNLKEGRDAVVDIREQFPLNREDPQAISEQARIRYPVDSQGGVTLRILQARTLACQPVAPAGRYRWCG